MNNFYLEIQKIETEIILMRIPTEIIMIIIMGTIQFQQKQIIYFKEKRLDSAEL